MNIFTTICRCCLGMNLDVINFFSPFGMIDNNDNVTVSDCFRNITNIKVEIDDNMPQTICKQCLTELKIAFNFRIKCELSDITLSRKCFETKEDGSEGKNDNIIDSEGDMPMGVQFDENIAVLTYIDQETTELVIEDAPELQETQVSHMHSIN